MGAGNQNGCCGTRGFALTRHSYRCHHGLSLVGRMRMYCVHRIIHDMNPSHTTAYIILEMEMRSAGYALKVET